MIADVSHLAHKWGYSYERATEHAGNRKPATKRQCSYILSLAERSDFSLEQISELFAVCRVTRPEELMCGQAMWIIGTLLEAEEEHPDQCETYGCREARSGRSKYCAEHKQVAASHAYQNNVERKQQERKAKEMRGICPWEGCHAPKVDRSRYCSKHKRMAAKRWREKQKA